MHTLFDHLTRTEGMSYVVVGILIALFIPFWRFLTSGKGAPAASADHDTSHHHP